MAKKKPAAASSMQLGIERGLRIAAWVLAVMHVLICTFRFVIDTTPYQTVVKWMALFLLLFSLAYLLLTKVKYPNTMYRVKTFFKGMKSYEQIYMIAFLLWFALTCWIRQSIDHLNYLKGLDWYLLDTGVSVFILFPMMFYAGKEKAKLYTEGFLHVISITYTIFTAWCMWHVFHLNVLKLPSGGPVGMTPQMQLMIGNHYNITGAISFTILAVCCYMIVTQKIFLKAIYGISAFVHLWVCMLSNSRTVYVSVLFLGAATVFFFIWYKLRERKITIRFFVASAAAGVIVLLLWWFRRSSFIWFDSITNFKELAGLTGETVSAEESIRELTGLSGRQQIWLGALKIMVSSPQTFFFGVTPAGVTQALKTIGGLTDDFAHAHNAVLQVGVSMGVPAMIAFVVFIIKLVIDSIRLFVSSKGSEFLRVFMIPVIVASLLVMNLAEAYLNFSCMSSILFFMCGMLTYKTILNSRERVESHEGKH